MIVATWTGISILLLLNIVGWVISFNRYSRNEAKHLGKMEDTIKGLSERIDSLERRIDTMDRRLNSFLNREE